MKHIYIFSGLGADESVFKNLHFPGFDTSFIRWVEPGARESIEQYAKMLTEQITISRPILIGLSFGGIMAIEVAKLIATEKIILISSVKTRKEIPFYYRLAGYLKLHKFLPIKLMKRSNIVANWLFGTANDEDRKMLAAILHNTNEKFLKWAIEKELRIAD